MIVADAHCHFFSDRFFTALARQRGDDTLDTNAVAAAAGVDPPGTADALADRWVAELDRHQVRRASLIASVPGDEESVARAVARHPSRFVGFFMLDPTQADAARRLEAALEQGLRTVCLFPAMHRVALHDPRVLDVAAQLTERPGTVLFAHCGALSVGIRKKLGLASSFESRFGNPIDLQGLASRFPGLPLIVPHFGGGFFREALMVGDLCPNVHFDTSSSNAWIRYDPALTLEKVFAQALSVVGPRRLLFGTDSSFFPRGWHGAIYDQQYSLVQTMGVPVADQEAIFGGNFDRLFPER